MVVVGAEKAKKAQQPAKTSARAALARRIRLPREIREARGILVVRLVVPKHTVRNLTDLLP